MAESASYTRRGHAGGARESTLASGINASATSFAASDLSTWTSTTTNGPSRATITDGTSEEEFEFTGISTNTFTGVTRGVGGTTAQAWDPGARIFHGSSIRDFDEANKAVAETIGTVTAAGDTIYADEANGFARLAKGTAYQAYIMNSGATAPNWAASLQSLMTAQGDIVYASSANTPARLAKGTAGQVLTMNSGATAPEWASKAPANGAAVVATSETTTSTSYTDLATSGPAVTVTTGTKALVTVTARMTNDTASGFAFMGFAVSGATTLAADDSRSLYMRVSDSNLPIMRISMTKLVTGLTAGPNDFTAKYKQSGGTGSFVDREISVIDMGS